ncbi:hypothetical protein [Cupriavidus gilardii]|uniref:Uncharacterized protein n=1 Tax=Cupriavidus gilardii TaxID=82541 RepID=A0A849BK68_9BURK|nr:hypothetical protein [Cupriavidus gilardii]KAB0597772.1 hypothetical protein F7Q96_07580 [Cupriavidus gilardii]NNH14408.1 hypothetical protein [Cupriavidus gilardii]
MDKRTLDELTRLHSNLTTFGAVIAVLEGGTVYGGVASEKAANRIIATCKKEMDRLVTRYDDLRAASQAAEGERNHG